MSNEEAFPAAPAPAPEAVTVEQLDAHVKKMAQLKAEITEKGAVVSKLNIEMARLEEQAMQYLKALDRKNYPTPFGTIYIAQNYQVKNPQTDADKAAMFTWMREKGIFDKYATVNNNSLKSLYKAEIEKVARENPEDALIFSIPGVERPTIFETVRVLKGKGDSDE
jgi:hypothetical protein